MTQSNRQTVFVNFSNATTVDVQLPSESDDCELPYLVHNVGLAGEMVDTFKRLVERCSLTQCACSNDRIGNLVSSKNQKKKEEKKKNPELKFRDTEQRETSRDIAKWTRSR